MQSPAHSQTLPKDVAVYYDAATQARLYVLLWLLPALLGGAACVVPRGEARAELAGVAAAAALLLFVFTVPFLFDLRRYWRHGPWARERKPYVAFGAQGITLLGDAFIPWAATTFVHLNIEQRGARRTQVRILEVGLDAQALKAHLAIPRLRELEPYHRRPPGSPVTQLNLYLGFADGRSALDHLTMTPDDIAQWAQAYRNAALAAHAQ